MHLISILPRAAVRVVAGGAWRAQVVACRPHHAVRPARVDQPLGGIAVAEIDPTGRVGAQIGLTVIDPVVETDIEAGDRFPYAGLAQLVLQHPRNMRGGEGLDLIEAEIAHAAPFSDQHRAITRERDI